MKSVVPGKPLLYGRVKPFCSLKCAVTLKRAMVGRQIDDYCTGDSIQSPAQANIGSLPSTIFVERHAGKRRHHSRNAESNRFGHTERQQLDTNRVFGRAAPEVCPK